MTARHLTLRAAMMLAGNDDWRSCPDSIAACDWRRLPHEEMRSGQHFRGGDVEVPSAVEPTCPHCRVLFDAAKEEIRAHYRAA